MIAIGGGQRLDVLRVLAAEPKDVKAVCKGVFNSSSAVSRELMRLLESDLVACEHDKTHHIYRLSGRVRAVRSGTMTQLALVNNDGQWIIVHTDDAPKLETALAPPEGLIGIPFSQSTTFKHRLGCDNGGSENH
jgi:DNA-binding transcriptional ArsR family regulator